MMPAVGGTVHAPIIAAGGTLAASNGTTVKTADFMRAPTTTVANAMLLSLEQLLTMSQEADSAASQTKTIKIENDGAERKKKLDETIAEMKKQAEERDSPGFFGSIVKIVKDFASDLVTDPTKLASDLGSNIKSAVNSSNFWADLKKICMKVVEVVALAASAAATVLTAGAGGALIAGVLLGISALNFAQSEFQVMQRIGISPKLAAGLQLGLSVAAIALSFGTNVGSTATALRAIKEASAGIEATGTAVGGVATIADAKFQSDALDRQAHLKALQSNMDTLNDAIKLLLEQLGEHKDTSQAVVKGINDAADQDAKTTQSITSVRA